MLKDDKSIKFNLNYCIGFIKKANIHLIIYFEYAKKRPV